MAFMRPTAIFFARDEAREFVCSDDCSYHDDECDDHGAGWYGRLSAPGYMDCTDWGGPHASKAVALASVCDMFDVDENGDDLPDD
jgi:hypothetical protein